MIPTIATRFGCSHPLSDLFEMTLMFTTLIFHYLNKLVEGKVRDFASPKAFHTVNVQGFTSNRLKLFTKIGRKFPMKIFALIGNFTVKSCDLSNSTSPAVRTFLFTAKCFVEITKFGQGLLQRLWVLDFLTRAKCQVSVFHTKVCPNALTCCRQRFGICEVRCDAKPIDTAIITLDCNVTDCPMPLTVFVKRIWHFIKSPLTLILIPFAECEGNTILFYLPTRLTRESNRFEFMTRFDMRSATEFIEKSLVSSINAFQLTLDRLRRQCFPMRVRRLFQHR